MKKILRVVVGAALLLLGASACGPSTTSAPPETPWCSLSATWTGVTHRVAIHAESNLPTGTVASLELYGNEAYLDTWTETVEGPGSIDDVLDVPRYAYDVAYDAYVVYRGSRLCSTTYVQFETPKSDDWFEDPGVTYGF